MDESKQNLGLSFFENQLFYAVNDPSDGEKLARIGSVDFNFDVTYALLTGDEEYFSGIKKTVSRLGEQYDIGHIRILSYPTQECWTTLPKLVYDSADERESHISILMQGIDRRHVHPTWYTLSNQDYRFLLLRNTRSLQGLEKLASSASTADLVSEFELGERWAGHRNARGSFMTVCCFHDCLSVSSYILGKLRGATYITFEDPEDLPYLWLQRAGELGWMEGLHEEIHVYGTGAFHIIDILKPFWDEAGEIIRMDSLERIQVEADERTYGFSLERAYPAIILALG